MIKFSKYIDFDNPAFAKAYEILLYTNLIGETGLNKSTFLHYISNL